MQKPILLVIDDDPEAREEVQILFKEKFEVLEAPDSYKGLFLARKQRPRLIILDQLLGEGDEMDGLKVLEELRDDVITQQIPVILRTILGGMLAFRAEAHARGAFIVTPRYKNNLKEVPKTLELQALEAQVNQFFHFITTWQNRPSDDADGFFGVDVLNHAALLGDGRRAFLGEKEFKLYYLLVQKWRQNAAANRLDIMRYVYDQERYSVEDDITINALSNELRKKLNPPSDAQGAGHEYIKAIRGIGYRLEEP